MIGNISTTLSDHNINYKQIKEGISSQKSSSISISTGTGTGTTETFRDKPLLGFLPAEGKFNSYKKYRRRG
jgi:hypothetical protein